MARIRTIKPEFPQSESMGRLSRDARLLFVQLWTIADDDGKARAASRLLASLLYPYDDDAPALIDGWLAELEAEGCIQRYTVGGASYLQVCKWADHQKIDRPSVSKLPSPPCAKVDNNADSAKAREDSRGLDDGSATDLGPRTLDLSAPPARPAARTNDPKWEPLYAAIADAGLAAFKANGQPSGLSGKIAKVLGPASGERPAVAASMFSDFWESPDAEYFSDREPATSISKWLRKQPSKTTRPNGHDDRFWFKTGAGAWALKDPQLVAASMGDDFKAGDYATWPEDMQAAYRGSTYAAFAGGPS